MILSNSANRPIQIDRYKVLSQLGKSGFGTVYHVVDKDDKSKEYALKFLHNSFNVKHIGEQLKILKVLNSSSLFLKTYLSKKVLNKFFLLLEYTPEENIYKQVKEELFDEKKSIKILLKMLKILKFFNENNIIHGDIKAENILKKGKKYYLVDYDIAKSTQDNKTVHIQSDDDFTAPEVYKGNQTKASDIYALGCTLYFMLSGEHIYGFNDKTDFSSKMFAHLYTKPKSHENISKKMQYLIARMTDKNENSRATIKEIKKIIKKEEAIEKLSKIENLNDDFTNQYERYKFMAKDGVSYAQNIFGLLHENGDGAKQDMKTAVKWYKEASKQGLSKADFNLGLCYKLGKAVSIDYDKARDNFKKASKKGHSRSYFQLGIIYEEGLGVIANQAKSLENYKLSASYGYRQAYKKLQELL